MCFYCYDYPCYLKFNVLHVLSQELRNVRFYLVITYTTEEHRRMYSSSNYNAYESLARDYTYVHTNQEKRGKIPFFQTLLPCFISILDNESRSCTNVGATVPSFYKEHKKHRYKNVSIIATGT